MSADPFDSSSSRCITAEAVRIYRKAVEAAAEKGECKCGSFHIDVTEAVRYVVDAHAARARLRKELVGRCPLSDGTCPVLSVLSGYPSRA